jgi:hypothetical protein
MVRHNTRRQDTLTNTTPKLPAVVDSEKGRLKAAGLIPSIPLDQAPLSPKVERKYTYQPTKKVIPKKEEIQLTEAAGVPTNCSPFMYYQMRKYLRFPSAQSMEKAAYTVTSEHFGQTQEYKKQPFQYPKALMEGADYSPHRLTEAQAESWANAKDEFYRSYTTGRC